MSIITDNTVLVHIYSGLESKNKVTLGLLVALEAEKNDHKVTLFLAGDGVNLLSCKKAGEVVGQGTGDLYDHLENLKNSKVSIYVSGLSAKYSKLITLSQYSLPKSMIGILFFMPVWRSVNSSNNSSSVPKPPGKNTAATDRITKWIFLNAK